MLIIWFFLSMRGSITELIVECVMLQYRQGSQGDISSAGDSWYWGWSNWFFSWPGNLWALPSCCWTSLGRCMYWINVIFLLYDKESYKIVYEIKMAGWPMLLPTSGVPRNFVRGGGSTNSVEDRGQRERESGGSSPLVRGSWGSCNLVQEISFQIVKFS